MTAHVWTSSTPAPVAAPASGAQGPGFSLAGLWRRLRLWAEISRQRRALTRLTPQQLRDIGLDAEAASAEAGRLFWDAPRHWRV